MLSESQERERPGQRNFSSPTDAGMAMKRRNKTRGKVRSTKDEVQNTDQTNGLNSVLFVLRIHTSYFPPPEIKYEGQSTKY